MKCVQSTSRRPDGVGVEHFSSMLARQAEQGIV
jgi:hypothetical protein